MVSHEFRINHHPRYGGCRTLVGELYSVNPKHLSLLSDPSSGQASLFRYFQISQMLNLKQISQRFFGKDRSPSVARVVPRSQLISRSKHMLLHLAGGTSMLCANCSDRHTREIIKNQRHIHDQDVVAEATLGYVISVRCAAAKRIYVSNLGGVELLSRAEAVLAS